MATSRASPAHRRAMSGAIRGDDIGYSWSLLRRAGVNRRRRTLLRRILHIPLHFEARQQFDIAGGAVDAGFLVALLFCAGSNMCPFRLKGVGTVRDLDRIGDGNRSTAADDRP